MTYGQKIVKQMRKNNNLTCKDIGKSLQSKTEKLIDQSFQLEVFQADYKLVVVATKLDYATYQEAKRSLNQF